MSWQTGRAATTAEALRAAFDRSFAESQAKDAVSQVDLLAIRSGEHEYALRLSEVLAVHTDRKLVAVPGPMPELLGLVGLRGLVVPVYDLRQLLGYPAGPLPRWLALARATSPFAVAFEGFEAHLRVQASDVVAPEAGAAAPHRFARGSVRTAAGPRPLIHLPSLIEGVTRGNWRESSSEREERR
jgi:chemotaxis signal transduction protein